MAIVTRAAGATRHWVPAGVQRGDRMYHLLSDRFGAEGRAELVAFARRYGLRPPWLQYAGTYREHFDVREDTGLAMTADGAVLLTDRELGTLLAAKRAAGGMPTTTAR